MTDDDPTRAIRRLIARVPAVMGSVSSDVAYVFATGHRLTRVQPLADLLGALLDAIDSADDSRTREMLVHMDFGRLYDGRPSGDVHALFAALAAARDAALRAVRRAVAKALGLLSADEVDPVTDSDRPEAVPVPLTPVDRLAYRGVPAPPVPVGPNRRRELVAA
jgi:hypothetical protein